MKICLYKKAPQNVSLVALPDNTPLQLKQTNFESDTGNYVNLGTLTAYPGTFSHNVLILKMYIFVLPRIMDFTRNNEKFG